MNPFDGLINDMAACRLCSREKISYQIGDFQGQLQLSIDASNPRLLVCETASFRASGACFSVR